MGLLERIKGMPDLNRQGMSDMWKILDSMISYGPDLVPENGDLRTKAYSWHDIP
jgi:hypothetical protein